MTIDTAPADSRTDSSHLLFDEVAHDFLMSGFVFSLNRPVHRSRARLLRGLAMLRKIGALLDGNFVVGFMRYRPIDV